VHVPRAVGDPVAPAVAALASLAVDRRLVVCAGAGLSKAQPANLPLGGELAELVYDDLVARLGEAALDGAGRDDLLAVADTVEALPGGSALLQTALENAADYTTAEPNYGHRVLALLLLEGAVEVIETNYDNCIERGSGNTEYVQAIVTDEDRQMVRGPAVLKVHGCATRAGSLLASSKELEAPPTWVFHHFGERLGAAVLVFVGLGDVARYVRIRITQLLDEIGNTDQIWVASRSLSDAWKELVPQIDDRFIPMTADEFLEDLLRDYAGTALRRLCTRAVSHRDQQTYSALHIDPSVGADRLAASLSATDAVTLVSWLRGTAYRWESGEQIVHSPSVDALLLALAIVAAKLTPAFDGRYLTLSGEKVEIVLVQNRPATAAIGEAVRRIGRGRAAGDIGIRETVVVLSHGHEGPLSQDYLESIIPGEHSDDIIDGPAVPLLRLVSAHRIVEGELPAEWAA
jgi:hypothetical protein